MLDKSVESVSRPSWCSSMSEEDQRAENKGNYRVLSNDGSEEIKYFFKKKMCGSLFSLHVSVAHMQLCRGQKGCQKL